MPPSEETTLALLGQSVAGLTSMVEGITQDMKAVLAVANKHSLLQQDLERQEELINTLFTKHDIICQKADSIKEECLKSISVVSAEGQKWINMGQGAFWTLGILLTTFNVLLISLTLWLFSSVSALREARQVTEVRLETIEQTVKNHIDKTVKIP